MGMVIKGSKEEMGAFDKKSGKFQAGTATGYVDDGGTHLSRMNFAGSVFHKFKPDGYGTLDSRLSEREGYHRYRIQVEMKMGERPKMI